MRQTAEVYRAKDSRRRARRSLKRQIAAAERLVVALEKNPPYPTEDVGGIVQSGYGPPSWIGLVIFGLVIGFCLLALFLAPAKG